MDIIDRIRCLRRDYIRVTGKEPNVIYIGHTEKRELYESPRFQEMVQFMPRTADLMEFDGIPMLEVMADDHLVVTSK